MSNEEIYHWEQLDSYIEHCKMLGQEFDNNEFYYGDWVA